MLGTELVWARDAHEGYIQGRIAELGAHEYEVLPVDRAHQKRTCSIDDIFPSCEAKSDNDDNCEFKMISRVKIFRGNFFSILITNATADAEAQHCVK
jgi:myosin-6